MVQADDVPEAGDGAVTQSLVERLTSARKGARTEEDARSIADAQCEIERLRSQGGAVPEGWQLVPKEPTEAMMDYGMDAFLAAHDPLYAKNEPMVPIYRAMLSAAPQPPVSQSVQPPEGGTGWRDGVTVPVDLAKEIWSAVKEVRDQHAFAERRSKELSDLLRRMKQAGLANWIPTLEEVQAAGPYVRVGLDETLDEATRRTATSPPGQGDRADDGSDEDGGLNHG